MSWEAISAIADTVGVLLIVASLAYVAKQLRQNNSMMRVSAAAQRLERDYDIVLPVVEHREFAEKWIQGGNRFDDLDEVDQQRVLFFERRAIVLWHHMYQLRIQGLLPDANWYEQTWIIQNIGRRQAVRRAWEIFRHSFETPFQEFVDDQFDTGDRNLSES